MQSELGMVMEQLLKEFIPEDVPLGTQLTPSKAYEYGGGEKNKSDDEVITIPW